jgi:spore maturation protein CgeB
MVALGYSPSVRIFEASACATPIISDYWRGLGEMLRPGREIAIADKPEAVEELLARPESERRAIGRAAQRRVLAAHTSMHRAAELEAYLDQAKRARAAAKQPVLRQEIASRLAVT